MMVLDTTVLVYAVGAEHPLRQPCRDLVEAVGEGRIDATTTVEAIQEFVHVRARRRTRADAAAHGRDYIALLMPLLSVTDTDLAEGFELFVRSPELSAFDAVLIATAMSAGATHVVSADQAFGSVRGVTHVVPDADGVSRLLS